MSVCDYYKNENIFHLKNVISEEDCKYIIDAIDKYKKNGKNVDHSVSNNTKSHVLELQHIDEAHIRSNCHHIFSKMLKDVISTSSDYLGLLKKQANYVHTVELRKIWGDTRYHVDGMTDSTNQPLEHLRVLSVIVALNSDYEGGELCFPEQDFKIKLKAGEVLAFPPYWTHPHYSNDLKNNTYRYTLTAWFCE